MARGVDFRAFSANISTVSGQPFSIDVLANELTVGELSIDTMSVQAIRNGNMLDYSLRMANRPENVETLSMLRLSGSVGGNAANIVVYERGRGDSVGFNFGANITLQDKTLRAQMTPANPILGYGRWTVNEGNSFEYDTDGKFGADLRLTGPSGNEYIALSSASLPDIPDGALKIDMVGVDVTPILEFWPTWPPLGGTVSSDLTFGFRDGGVSGKKIIAATGNLGVGGFTYNKNRVADVDASIDFQSDATGQMALTASVILDRTAALSAHGTYTAQAMDFTVTIPGVPLAAIGAFLPEGTAKLSGDLNGNIHIEGVPANPVMSGDIGFNGGRAEVGMIGTTFGISPERVKIDGSRLSFNDFGIIAPNNRKLAIDGSIDISNFADPVADMTVTANNFQVVNAQHISGSQVYGNAAFDAGVTLKGPVSTMTVRGNVALAPTTDIVYILRNQSKVKDEKQHIVTFTVFADSLYTEGTDAGRHTRRTGVDMLVGMSIPEGVKATLSLDELNENRVELVGTGDLAFSMNMQGDTRLAGRYTLSGGSVYYRPPVIPQKIFAVKDGSYVEWTGEAASPEFHITATQTTTAELTYEAGTSEQVAFDISIDISGSLKAMNTRFDVAAPKNLAIQNQLMSMSEEGRMQQALTLLVYGQYTGPGTSSNTKMGFDARNTLNNFISKELNQWARNNLNGVDVSMGIDSRNDAMGQAHTNYSYSVSKSMFSDRVKMSIGGSVADNATSQNFANNLLEDITLEYRLTDRDNMFLKLYRYNTQESILEGEVTETGGGFVLRKKMSRLGDLFRRTMPRNRTRSKRTGEPVGMATTVPQSAQDQAGER
jgi:hypothetical protein